MGEVLEMIFPTIQRNKIWKCPLLPELLKLYNIQTQQENVYIHWCEINDAPDNHKFFKEDILFFCSVTQRINRIMLS